MKCPACETLVTKVTGCDAIVCGGCKQKLCWVTKKLREGPNVMTIFSLF